MRPIIPLGFPATLGLQGVDAGLLATGRAGRDPNRPAASRIDKGRRYLAKVIDQHRPPPNPAAAGHGD